VHFSLEEFKVSMKSSFSPQSLCHTISPRDRVWCWAQNRNPGFLWPESESGVLLNFLTLELESESRNKQRLHIRDNSSWTLTGFVKEWISVMNFNTVRSLYKTLYCVANVDGCELWIVIRVPVVLCLATYHDPTTLTILKVHRLFSQCLT